MAASTAFANWGNWRGPNHDGVSMAKNLPDTWSETENVLWKTPLPSAGSSTPVIIEGKIFLTCEVERTVQLLCISKAGKELWRQKVCDSGKGGKGNVHFKSPTNQAPQEHTLGTKGESGYFYLELRQIADAGFVGFPNAGKSSLLGSLSAAKPKVANYPFTTLQPSIGIIEFSSLVRASLADIPGLIEGAHENVGLGHNFLRHIMRCDLLLFVVDVAGVDMRDPVEDVETLRKEIKMYSEELASRDWLLIANKIDVEGAKDKLEVLKIRFPNLEIIPVSALSGEGINQLKLRLRDLIGKEIY